MSYRLRVLLAVAIGLGVWSAAGLAAVNGMADRASHRLQVRPLQEYHRGVGADEAQLSEPKG